MRAEHRRVATLGGPLGDALEASRLGRLSHFIVDESSPAIALFDPSRRDTNHEGDWYGEHAGKWLYAASRAAARSADPVLRERVLGIANHLVGLQADDGYLGTYAEPRRFMHRRAEPAPTWDGAPSMRTWDAWTHAYLVSGLLEVHRHFPDPRYVVACRRIVDLFARVLERGEVAITSLGNHHGMSATILLDPAVELFFATGDTRYVDLGRRILAQAEENPRLALQSRAAAGVDAADIGTGKAYQLLWNVVGLAKLHRATDDPELLCAAQNVWESVHTYHLTLGGGPWGGLGHRSREVFNAPGFFSPSGYVETCSVLAWIQLNRELLTITGEARYADEIERSAWNALLGAMGRDGEDWCYYAYENGPRVHTTYWRCCKSSGAMALEELPELVYRVVGGGEVVVDLYGPGSVAIALSHGRKVRIAQRTRYPDDGVVRLRIEFDAATPLAFALRLRVPAWADALTLAMGDAPLAAERVGGYLRVERVWTSGDELVLSMAMHPVAHRRANTNVQESRGPAGEAIRQTVRHDDHIAFTRGPLVLATGLVDGYRRDETLREPIAIDAVADAPDGDGAMVSVISEGRDTIPFEPYWSLGGREDGTWRLTWLALAPDSPARRSE
ncbi:MAG: beta-L-arabinofuranosidase domain-containing protein [Burkholderiaceae bacterium]